MNKYYNLKKISLILISIICLSSISISEGSSINHLQNSSNDILYVGCNEFDCYPTIQSAIDAAKWGDTIFVFQESSPYNENIIISKSLNIIGENKNTTIIDGKGMNSVVYITSDSVYLTNFTIRNGGNHPGIIINSDNNLIKNNYLFSNSIGIKCEYSQNNIISINKINDNGDNGILLYGSSNNYITECIIENNYKGISLDQNSINNTIYGNDIIFNQIGINLESSSLNNIYWNMISDSIYGLYSIGSSNNNYNENFINKNHNGMFISNSPYCIIKSENVVSNNDNYGLYLFESDNSIINENTISDNKYGIIINNSNNLDIYWNHINNNENGINLYNNNKINIFLNYIQNNLNKGIYSIFCKSLIISYNNFMNNNCQSYFVLSSIFNHNKWANNYWDDWNGIGSYRINGEINGFIQIDTWYKMDRNPVDNPYDIK